MTWWSHVMTWHFWYGLFANGNRVVRRSRHGRENGFMYCVDQTWRRNRTILRIVQLANPQWFVVLWWWKWAFCSRVWYSICGPLTIKSSSYLAWLWNFVCMTTLIFFWIRQASQSTSYAPHHSRVLLHLAMSSYVMSCRTYAAWMTRVIPFGIEWGEWMCFSYKLAN